MSAKIMGQVWDLKIPFNQAWVLLAMADHADHQGKNVFPSLPLEAWKTGYSLSNVKAIVRQLKDEGILVEYSRTRGGVKIYRIELMHVLRKEPFVEPDVGRPKGSYDRTPRKTQSEINTGFSSTHNHQFSINNRESEGVRGGLLLSNSSTYTTRQSPPDFTPDDDDPF